MIDLLCSGKLPEPQAENAAQGIVAHMNTTTEYILKASERVLFFFIKALRKVLVIDAHECYNLSVVNFNKSKFGLLCKATKMISVFKTGL